MEEKKALPWNILAITFTNKAANEMKERIEGLVGDAGKDMWIGTFHSGISEFCKLPKKRSYQRIPLYVTTIAKIFIIF